MGRTQASYWCASATQAFVNIRTFQGSHYCTPRPQTLEKLAIPSVSIRFKDDTKSPSIRRRVCFQYSQRDGHGNPLHTVSFLDKEFERDEGIVFKRLDLTSVPASGGSDLALLRILLLIAPSTTNEVST